MTRYWIDLSHRAKWLLEGVDAARYLNGQITNRVADLAESEARYACVANHKGKLEADLYFRRWKGAWLIDADSSLRESLKPRLEKYIVSDDVIVSDLTDELDLFHVMGCEPAMSNRFRCERWREIGWDMVVPKGTVSYPELETNGYQKLDETMLDWLRVSRGCPTWGRELTPDILPPEARLEAKAIDYGKGCYLGQEVISRMKTAGKLNRILTLLKLRQGNLPELGSQLLSENDEPAGHLTSLARDPRSGQCMGLGFVRMALALPGTKFKTVNANGSCAEFELQEFPSP